MLSINFLQINCICELFEKKEKSEKSRRGEFQRKKNFFSYFYHFEKYFSDGCPKLTEKRK